MTQAEIFGLLQQSDLKGLPDEILERLAANATVANFRKGDKIFDLGEFVQWAGLIVQGILRVYSIGKNNEEQVWSFLKEKDFCLVAYSFFDDCPSRHVVQALEDTQVVYISRNQFLQLGQENLTFKSYVYETLSRRMMHHMQVKSDLLNMNASHRYQYFVERYPNLMARVPLGQISSFLGIRQSSLSRIRRNLSQTNKSSPGNGN